LSFLWISNLSGPRCGTWREHGKKPTSFGNYGTVPLRSIFGEGRSLSKLIVHVPCAKLGKTNQYCIGSGVARPRSNFGDIPRTCFIKLLALPHADPGSFLTGNNLFSRPSCLVSSNRCSICSYFSKESLCGTSGLLGTTLSFMGINGSRNMLWV
jgi:hypothetical protein